jgi:hypothetical protein
MYTVKLAKSRHLPMHCMFESTIKKRQKHAINKKAHIYIIGSSHVRKQSL